MTDRPTGPRTIIPCYLSIADRSVTRSLLVKHSPVPFLRYSGIPYLLYTILYSSFFKQLKQTYSAIKAPYRPCCEKVWDNLTQIFLHSWSGYRPDAVCGSKPAGLPPHGGRCARHPGGPRYKPHLLCYPPEGTTTKRKKHLLHLIDGTLGVMPPHQSI